MRRLPPRRDRYAVVATTLHFTCQLTVTMAAGRFIMLLCRIAKSLELEIAGSQDVMLWKGERSLADNRYADGDRDRHRRGGGDSLSRARDQRRGGGQGLGGAAAQDHLVTDPLCLEN
jgi:hypothetical protein